MKRFLALAIMCAAFAALISCGEEETASSRAEQSQSAQTTEASSHDEGSSPDSIGNEIANDYNRFLKITGHDIYVNYKSGRRDEAKECGHLFYNSGEDIVIFVNGDSGYSEVVDDVFDLLNDGEFIIDAFTRVDGVFELSGNYPLVANETENIVVGDIDCVKFTGSVTDEEGLECYAYGYTFVIDETPCMLVGFVFTEEQTEEEISSIQEEVDTMMTTVRTEI